ncbi:unnamed protein product [Nezara viridula]|uniref:VWFA domain-containing protein n=1 Tax=Nezara viridula TaxID=85310 RepID=A0A9P0EAA5_NEZVI|nr:unnamed protein product [Nezara viridula]
MNLLWIKLLVLLIPFRDHSCSAKEEETVEKWAAKLGKELWELGSSVTKVPEIRSSYRKLNAQVLPTDGEKILHNIVSNVNRLLKRKMDSVMCLIEGAERLSEDFKDQNQTLIYFSSKFSKLVGVDDEENITNYRMMELEPDYHFYNIYVNTTHSAVHVPTDVFDLGGDVKKSLLWSEELDETFITNFHADPTMSWQYFGSSTGFLRHYPALHWNDSADVFDCRTRFWYIEAATCSKDILILIDSSGSMAGMKRTISQLTVRTLLDTFSNNDFINIFSFNEEITRLVPCFPKDMLVQATPENILLFKEAVKLVNVSDKANFRKALSTAFELMTKYRKQRQCYNDICNQAIILITDSVPENTTEIFQKYNWFENRTRIPVRVFTYLIGKELSNVDEIKNMACLNRGYFGHIKSLEEVRSEVLKYLNVIARPMVLQMVEHPLSWTHSFVDATGNLDTRSSSKEYRFMTSVSGPAFKIPSEKANETVLPELLGVAGTDVLISDIKSLTLPYKIGANGYAFVITNNGYILFHPDLRPIHDGEVKPNYNSIDLTEVELLDDQVTEPRKPHEDILKLREVMVNGTEGSTHGLKIKFHYDDMRRVGVEKRNYFYAPLNNTPFTMGLVLPHSYGNFWVKAGDEILKSRQMGIPVSSFFKGNWRIHPEWVYCDYHRTSERWFNSSEDKLLHFLEKISAPGWEWKDIFSAEDDSESHNCNRRSIDAKEYYCDKELMQLLVFDAKITEVSYKTSKWSAKDRNEEKLVKRYGASLRFVATQSGLTRWQHIPEATETSEPFGDTNNRALEEVWYRSAVLHHQLDSEAFVFSVPFDSGSDDSIKLTATHAIFPKDGGHEAPGSVVGFQIRHAALKSRFMQITSKESNCPECASCKSDTLDCYLIDGNGYVIFSEVNNDTGRFFGEVEGAIMEAMISKNIFRHVVMFDYQATCPNESTILVSAGWNLINPFVSMINLVKWILGRAVWMIIESEIAKFVYSESEEIKDYFDTKDDSVHQVEVTEVPRATKKSKEPKKSTEPCDKTGYLYLLQHLNKKDGYYSPEPVNCSRPFYVKRVPHTNLLLIVVNVLHQSCYRKLSSTMERIEYRHSNNTNSSLSPSSCQKLMLNSLPRRSLSGCFNTHPSESEFYQCSEASSFKPCLLWIIVYCITLLSIKVIL